MVAKKASPVEEPVEEVAYKPDPKSRSIRVETAVDTYELSKPRGKLGALHFRLLTKAMPKSVDEETGEVSPADQERMQEVFNQWIDEVLPEILTSHKYDDVPGEDQWVLFISLVQHNERAQGLVSACCLKLAASIPNTVTSIPKETATMMPDGVKSSEFIVLSHTKPSMKSLKNPTGRTQLCSIWTYQ